MSQNCSYKKYSWIPLPNEYFPLTGKEAKLKRQNLIYIFIPFKVFFLKGFFLEIHIGIWLFYTISHLLTVKCTCMPPNVERYFLAMKSSNLSTSQLFIYISQRGNLKRTQLNFSSGHYRVHVEETWVCEGKIGLENST